MDWYPFRQILKPTYENRVRSYKNLRSPEPLKPCFIANFVENFSNPFEFWVSSSGIRSFAKLRLLESNASNKMHKCEEWQAEKLMSSHADGMETENTTNLVTLRRKMFELHQQKPDSNLLNFIETHNHSPSSFPSQIAKDPPAIIQPKPNKFFENPVSPLSSEDSESSILTTRCQNNWKSTNGVKNMVEKLNKIGHRPFEQSLTTTNYLKIQSKKEEIAGEMKTDSLLAGEETKNGGGKGNSLSEQQWSNDGDTPLRKQSLVGSQEANINANILEEMRGKAIFKKSFIASGIPSEIGKYRPLSSEKKCSRKGCASDPSPGANCQLGVSSTTGQQAKTSSLLGCNKTAESQIEEGEKWVSVEHFGPIPQYDEMDEKENKRLRKLHEVAFEIYQTQRAYVKKLQLIGLSYPRHLNDCEKSLNKKLLHPKHVVRRIADHFKTILSVHINFLRNFYDKMIKWDSRKPDLSEVFQKNAAFLKICRLFLTEKQKLVSELQQVLTENQELADATTRFEQGVLKENSSVRHSFSSGSTNCGSVNDLNGISVILQLDAVHQNVVRYKLLMERYRQCLPDDLEEAKNADEALRKLTIVTNDLNCSLTVEDEEKKLLDLCGKLKGIFEVFAPGRKLLHSGELKRQTRKELQTRQLILFSDTLLICRCATLTPLDSLDAKYQIPIEKVQLKLPANDESECEFILLTPYKSSTFIAKSKWERDSWMKRIGEAVEEAIQKRATRICRKEIDCSLGMVMSSSNSHFCVIQSEPGCSSEKPKSRTQSTCEMLETTLTYSGDGLLDGMNTAKGRDESNSSESDTPLNEQLFPPNTALWVPDDKTSKCMNGCGTSFDFIHRKHHCRQCGCIICSDCEGMAPVGNAQGVFKRSKVCPKCYFDIRNAFENGFSARLVQSSSSVCAAPAIGSAAAFAWNDPSLRIRCENGNLFHPAKFFIAPKNGPMNIDQQLKDRVVSGKVLLKTHSKGSVLRWATLSAESELQFYKAQFDDQPAEQFIIFGYSIRHRENEDDGKTLIELTHRNQCQTERKEDQIVFFVQHSESAKKWLQALRKVVKIETK